MKIVTLSKIGYNSPGQANWNYGIWKIDLVDTNDTYCMSYTVKENFGGDSRLRAKVREKTGYSIIETKGVYTGTGIQKITGISKILDMEGDEIMEIIADFLKGYRASEDIEMLQRENEAMAKKLLKLDFTSEQVNDIANGAI